MTVGRKGHRAGETAYGDSDFSESPSPSATPSDAATPQQEQRAGFGSDQRTLSMRPAPSHSWTLPSFQTFVRDTFSDSFHRRSVSTSGETIGTDNMVWEDDLRHPGLRSGNRPASAQSGTWWQVTEAASSSANSYDAVRLQLSGSQSSNGGAARPRHHHNQEIQ